MYCPGGVYTRQSALSAALAPPGAPGGRRAGPVRQGECAIASRPRPPGRDGAGLVVWTLFSAVVGAGFATGQELVPFLRECASPPAAAVLACLLTGWLAWTRAASPVPPADRRPDLPRSRRCGWLLEPSRAAAVGVSWISLTAMEAALAHLLEGVLGRVPSLVAAAGLVALGAILPAARGLGRLSTILGPFMAAALTATGLWVAVRPPGPPPSTPAILPGTSRADALIGARPWAGRCALRVILYASANGLFAQQPLRAVATGLPSGPPEVARTAQVLRGPLPGLWGGALLGLVAGTGVWVMGRTASSGAVMPLVVSAEALHPAARIVYTASVAASAYTTAVAAAVGLGAGHLPGGRSERFFERGWQLLQVNARALLWVALAVPVAASGFAEAVQRLYPAAGWVALAALTLEGLFAAMRRRGLY